MVHEIKIWFFDDRKTCLFCTELRASEAVMPPLAALQVFDRLQAEIAALKVKYAAIRKTSATLLPATLERVFAGSQ